ncbi:condensation domain-containing protein [Streptomyces sp. NPDC048182]|uniref:condensation domain-containing protein n=1 Tax=Streptomyces sp. NPDC048182 TaxID=3365507 RepID=UPI00371217EC
MPPPAGSHRIEVRGPLDLTALHQVLDHLATGPARPPVRWHRPVRHTPGHHTLAFSAHGDGAARVAGRLADLLTEACPGDRPLLPAQCAVLAAADDPAGAGHEAWYVDLAAPQDTATVREALRAVLAVHPQLASRPDPAGGHLAARRASAPGAAPAHGDVLATARFTDEAAFTAAVARAARTLDAGAGIQVRAVLAADHRGGTRTDRLALVAHRLAVDTASWHTLLTDLTTALEAAAGRPVTRPRPSHGTPPPEAPEAREGADGLAAWADALRAAARDPAEARHWSRLARPGTPGTDTTAPAPPTAARRRQAGFTLDRADTERITRTLGERLALTAGQVLTGAFALALARWRHTTEPAFDVHADPRADRPALRRLVARLADVHPVRLHLDPAPDAYGQLTLLAGQVAAGEGGVAGGAGFGACREWSPDPLLRAALRGLPPATVCLALDAPAPAMPAAARPVPGAHGPHPHRLRVRVTPAAGRLRFAFDWHPDPARGVTRATVSALRGLLRAVLAELAAAAGAPAPALVAATPQQAALLAREQARPGSGHHVEQIVWMWHGPFDPARFRTAWQSVHDCETVLRTAFTATAPPRLLLHHRTAPAIDRHTGRGDGLSTFLAQDRRRGFDLRRPGALRLTVLTTPDPPDAGPAPPTRIVLTYHRALLDHWSAALLLRAFYRAYLAGGALPGGERRPDLGDYSRWLAAQDPAPARALWARTAPPPAAARWPGRDTGAGHPPGPPGTGRVRLRLSRAETDRLARWAARWGVTASSVLHAAWALLIHRARGAPGPAPVRFAVTVPGRGIALEGAFLLLGPLRNTLPVSVTVDPARPLVDLLRHLRDRSLDLAAYEWLPAARIRSWAPPPDTADADTAAAGTADADTVVVFEDPPHPVRGLEADLAAQGLAARFPLTVPARAPAPLELLARHDDAGALVLTAVHDCALLDAGAAGELLAQCALLLRRLPARAGRSTTVAQALALLDGAAVPYMARPAAHPVLVPLRPARAPGAGVVCLVPPPGAPHTCYDLLAGAHTGPEELLVPAAGAGADAVAAALAARAGGGPLLLAGFSGAGAAACELAWRLAAGGAARPPRVVLAAAGADPARRAQDLARALREPAPHRP